MEETIIEVWEKKRSGWRRKKKTIVYSVASIVLMVLVVGAWMYEAGRGDEHERDASAVVREEHARKALDEYEKSAAEDQFGGLTPEETLSLFADAVRRKDAEEASKYFVGDGNMPREKWQRGIENVISAGNEEELARFAENVEPSGRNTGSLDVVEYVTRGRDGTTEKSALLRRNDRTGVWKIDQL